MRQKFPPWVAKSTCSAGLQQVTLPAERRFSPAIPRMLQPASYGPRKINAQLQCIGGEAWGHGPLSDRDFKDLGNEQKT